MSDEVPVEIPHGELNPATLRGVLEEFCTRNGTEYGEVELSLDDKINLLMGQLRDGKAHLVFEANSQQLRVVHERDMAEIRG